MDTNDGLGVPAHVKLENLRALKEEAVCAIFDAARDAGGWDALRVGSMSELLGKLGRSTLFRYAKEIKGADLALSNNDLLVGLRRGWGYEGHRLPVSAPPAKVQKAIEQVQGEDVAEVISGARTIKRAGGGTVPRTPHHPPNPAGPVILPPPLTAGLPTLDETAKAIIPPQVMDLIEICLAAGRDVAAKSRDGTGQVRNSKLLLMAAEQLRRTVETAAKLQETIADQVQVDRFHQVCVEEIGKIDREVARRIVARLQEVNASWSARLNAEA
jgi:hypothetical protein